MSAIVTGGSGFIGSHLARALAARGEEVIIVDKTKPAPETNFIHCDLAKGFDFPANCETLFHFAASADVRGSMERPMEAVENNIAATQHVLDFCRKNDVKKLVFASTSTVYGKATVIPTPEEAELRPVSIYGATKAACELLIRPYHEAYGIDAIILRYANIYGPGSRRGVMHDFISKLLADSTRLEILGNGLQSKSYLYIDDAIDATLLAAKESGWKIFNVGSVKQTAVSEIAEIVINAMGLKNVTLKFLGGETGWMGDVPRFLLDVSKLRALGWREKTLIRDGIERYVKWRLEK